MNKTIQSKVAAILAILMLAALVAVAYLAFAFPSTLAAWADQGRPLSVTHQAIAKLSMACRAYGCFLLPMLLAGLVGSGSWMVIAAKGRRNMGSDGSIGLKSPEGVK